MLSQILKSPRAWSSRIRSATSSRTNATKKDHDSEKIMQKSGDLDQDLTDPCVKGEGGDRVYVQTKHIHDEIKDVEDGHVHVEVKDVDIKMAEKCKIGVAHQPDYSGKLWENGNNESAKNSVDINMDDPASHQLPKDWDLDMQDPNVKGEGGDRLYYEAKQLQNADMKDEDKVYKPKISKNVK